MTRLLAIIPIFSLATSQFVFFGHQHGPPRSVGAPAPVVPQPAPTAAPQAPRAGPIQIQPAPTQRFSTRPTVIPIRPSLNSISGDTRFAHIFFRPLRRLHHPGKNALPESNEPVKFVQILSDPDLILTEEGGVRRTTEAPAMSDQEMKMEAMRDGRLLVEPMHPEAIVPAAVVPLPSSIIERPTTTMTPFTEAPATIIRFVPSMVVKTMAPLRELERTMAPMFIPPVTTMAPATISTTILSLPVTTAKPMMRIVSTFQMTPFIHGTPTVTRQLTTSQVQTPALPRTPRIQAQRTPVPTQSVPRAPKALSSRPKGNYEFQGKNYLLSWRMGRNNFDWSGGVNFCRSKGMALISLDNKEKTEHFLRLVSTDRAPYFWSGGEVSRDSRTLTWQNGEQEPIVRGQHPWSFTGRTGPQPDGGERCVAVLNSVYRDGVKFHDVACHHRKPVVCQQL